MPTRSTTRRRIAATLAIATLAPAGCAVDPPSAVVGVRVQGCSLTTEKGSGIIVRDGLVLTSAHVLRGARSVEVTRGDETWSAEIVGFDPNMDLAYLATDRTGAGTVTVGGDDVEAGDRGDAWVVRRDGIERIDVTVSRRLTINTEDIYVKGATERPGWELEADIEPGDSGGAVIVDGSVIGVLWARSRRFPGRSYAIDPDRAGDLIRDQLRAGELGDDIDISRCS